MIGFQCAAPPAAKEPQQPPSQADCASGPQKSAALANRRCSSSSSASTSSAGSSSSAGQPHQQQHCRSPPSTGPMKMAAGGAHQSQSQQHKQQQQQQQQQRQQHQPNFHPADQRLGSPGYHSAASSPGSSSVASPVSSSASTTSGCSSSGISTTSSLSSSCAAGGGQPGAAGSKSADSIVSSMGTVSLAKLAGEQRPPAPLGPARTPNPHRLSLQQQQHHQHLQQHQQQPADSLAALLDYFAPETRHNALNLSWFHEANSRAALAAALDGGKLVVSGDISLAEMSRYPVPIMARPPLGVSDLTLENWLTEVLRARKAIKLTFTSTRTVEPAFRVLARHADQLKGPLILSADILGRSSDGRQQQQPVDAWTFLMLCRTRFPKSIISIGWCAATAAELAEPGGAAPADSIYELDLLAEQQQQARGAPFQAAGQQQSMLGRQLHQHQRAAGLQFQASAILSSNGSLNSSSGNSSGSPSPTSPIGHLMGAHHGAPLIVGQQQQQQHAHRMRNQLPGCLAGEQLILAATAQTGPLKSWPAVAAAAMVAQLQQQQQYQHQEQEQEQEQDQLPLNLNINEADPQHAVSRLAELAHTIQSLQRQSNSLNSISSQLQQQQQSDEATAAALALAGKLLAANEGRLLLAHQAEAEDEAHKWEHVSKKAALSTRLNSNSPSPVATSPKQQQLANLLSCVKAGQPQPQPQLQAHQHQQHQAKLRQLARAQQPGQQLGYTREMIDRMSSLVKEYNLTQAITFPVEARWLSKRGAQSAGSLGELQRLLYQVGPNSTLTIVAQPEDLISVDDLLVIRKHFAPNQILFDLPDELASSLRNELDC